VVRGILFGAEGQAGELTGMWKRVCFLRLGWWSSVNCCSPLGEKIYWSCGIQDWMELWRAGFWYVV